MAKVPLDELRKRKERSTEIPEKTRSKPPGKEERQWPEPKREEKSERKRALAREAKSEPKSDRTVDAFAAVDEAIKRMEKANIAFNAPKTLNRDATVMIHLLLSMSQGSGDLSKMVKGKGERETAIVPVTQIMQAHLSGPNFQVTPITPEEQPISRFDKTEWKWNVKPTSVGEQALNLALNAVVTAAGNERKMTVRTFDHVIFVEVTAGQQVTEFFSGNWQWLWAAIAVPIAGAVWQTKLRKSRTKSRY
jgi:hypothetical protein